MTLPSGPRGPCLGSSRLGLGTVQFGLPYGIANTTGQVPYPEVLRILRRAREAGVTLLDTARGYGSSEQAIGRAIRELGAREHFLVCTKLDIGHDYEGRPAEAVVSEVRSSLEASREALGVERLPVLLLHVPAQRTWGGGVIWKALEEQKRQGRIGALGVSMDGRSVQGALDALEDPSVEVLQIPLNAFDQRWSRGGVLQAASRRGVAVVARSIYLQGLLLMPPERVPPKLGVAIPLKRRFEQLARRGGMGAQELAYRYAVHSIPAVTAAIVGVDSLAQLEQNLRLQALGALPPDLTRELEGMFAEVPELVLVPKLWES